MNKPQEIIEAVETNKPWMHKVRSCTNRRKWYDVIQRRDETFFCTCPSFKFGKQECKHIDIIKIILEE